MRHDLAPQPVLERGDDFTSRGVVLGVRGKAQEHVKRETHGVAFDLDVPFLHDVEESDLHLAGEIGELIQREDAAIGAWEHSVLDRQLVRQQVATAGRLDRIEVSDDIGDRHVGGREFLDVPTLAIEPRDRCVVPRFGDELARVLRDRPEWVVVDLAARDDRDGLIEECRQRAQYPGFRLPAQPEQNEVVAGQEGVDELRHDRLVVADHAFEQPAALAKTGQQVVAHLVLDRSAGQVGGAEW